MTTPDKATLKTNTPPSLMGDDKQPSINLAKKISKSLDKQKRKASVKSIIIYCVPCSKNYSVIRKDDKGELVKQQVCQHITFQKVLIK